jgi:transcriptional regulator with XRE-family HTH domain
MYGAKIRSLRGLLGLSQEEFCKLAGVNRYTLSNVESERNTNPTPSFIKSIEDALGVSLDDPRIEQFIAIANPESIAA